MSSKVATKSPSSSLGASGAVLAVVAASASYFPEAGVSLIFLPFFSIPASQAVWALMTVDLVVRPSLFS